MQVFMSLCFSVWYNNNINYVSNYLLDIYCILGIVFKFIFFVYNCNFYLEFYVIVNF